MVVSPRRALIGKAIRITCGDDEAIQHRRFIGVEGDNDMIAVVAPIPKTRETVSKQIARQDGLVALRIAGVGISLLQPGVPPSERHFIKQRKGRLAITQDLAGSLVGLIATLGDVDLNRLLGCVRIGQGILKVTVGAIP